MPDDFVTIVTGLRAWTATHDAHVRSATELLIWHERWLRRTDFRKACVIVRPSGPEVLINWGKARAFVDQNPQASTSELAVLDLAVALGENRYRLSSMGNAHSQAIREAWMLATGLEGI